MKFAHLHVHTHYSLLDGLTKIDELIETVKNDGATAVAMTDHGVMYGCIEFYQKCKKAGIKPIIGLEAYLAPSSRFDKITRSDGKLNYHLLLLAKNNIGYKNLIKLTSIAHMEGFYYKPRIDWEVLKEHSEGLIGATACMGGEIPALIRARKLDKARKRIIEYNELFGQDNFYLEIQDHPTLEGQDEINQGLIKFSRELNVPLIATNDVHYLKKEDDEAQDILLCLQNKKKINDTDRMKMTGVDYSLRPASEFIEAFKDVPEAIENTQKIADMCNVDIELGKIQLPVFEVPESYDDNSYLRKLCEDGLKARYNKSYDEIEDVVRERIDYELSVITKMGFSSYLLIVADFVSWSKKNGVIVGPGRGSAAGSLICYLTGITNIDPLKYDLIFERFLNPDRNEMPDIDLDFADIRRDEVIRYVEDKYGKDHVAQIITFGTMAARAAIRDVGRVLDYPYDYCDLLAKKIPMFTNLETALKNTDEVKDAYNNEEGAKRIIDYARRLEGVSRHSSTHACGVLITKDPLTENVPIQYASSSDKTIVSQYSLHPVEDLGLLKMDFLGLKNLTIIESALKILKNTRGLDISIDEIPLEDKATFKLFQEGETTGVFQFECLSGDTIVSNTTIKKLYERKNKKRLASVYLDEGKVHLNEVVNVVKSGVKETYSMVADNDWFIKATKDHQFLTEDGWKRLVDVKIGDKILVKKKAKHLVYNICKQCGKQISGQYEGRSDFCYRCSATFYSNPSKLSSRKKISAARKKFYKSGGQSWNLGLNKENSSIMKATGRKISKALVGKTLEDYHGPEKAKEMRKKMSKRASGARNPMFGKPAPHRKGGWREDLGHYVRSTWEADFARILKYHNLEYEYEPKIFRLKRANGEPLNYTPDFYVPSINTFYEIKGWYHDLDKEKIKLFKKQYPEYNFELISATKFAEFALRYKSLIAWECPRIPEGFHFVKVKQIVSNGREMTYDVAMKSPGNNFIANGFVVHNSSGMKRYLKELKPTEFEDIIAMVALYRPGPMEWIPDYIAGKNRRKKPEYLHPKLEPILTKTYGVAIYQEQVMQMARDLAGFTMAEADVLRKAVGKKIPKLLQEQKEKFINMCGESGIDKKLAGKIFSFIEPFAGYGFNRSHAACYALIGYQTAYLKAHWPTEFMAALLTADQQNIDRVAVEIEECRRMGIEVKRPDINQSYETFTVVTSGTEKNQVADSKEKTKTIRFGLNAIKNIGENIANVIIKERKSNGPYEDISDILERITDKDLNKKSLESLIKSGGLDKFSERGRLMGNIENLLAYNKELAKTKNNGQASLFADAPNLNISHRIRLNPAPKASKQELLSWEKELMGLYISAHPYSDFREHLSSLVIPLNELKNNIGKDSANVAGVITKIKKIITRTNKSMLFVSIEDHTVSAEVLVFPNLLKETADIWKEGKTVLCQGKLSDKDQEVKILANTVHEINLKNIETVLNKLKRAFNSNGNGYNTGGSQSYMAPKPLKIVFKNNISADNLNKIKAIFLKYPGQSKVIFEVKQNGNSKTIETAFRVNRNNDLSREIMNVFSGTITTGA